MRLRYLFVCLCILCLTKGYAQQIKTESKCIKLKNFRDTDIVSFENDPIILEFSAEKIIVYLTNELKKSKWQIKEYDGKRKLLDSLNGGSNTIHIRTTNIFSTAQTRGILSSAMLAISYDLLKKGYVRIKKGKQYYKKVIYKYIDGPYGNKSALFILDNKPFFEYIIALGE